MWITHLFSYKIFEFESLFTVIYLMFVIQLNFGFHLFVFILDVINVKCSLWNIVHDGHRFMMNTLFHDENIICLTKIQPEACEIFFFLSFSILLSYFRWKWFKLFLLFFLWKKNLGFRLVRYYFWCYSNLRIFIPSS